MADGVPVAADHEHHEGESRLTGAQISAINRFPDDNPNPVMRIDADGHLIYANPASEGLLQGIGISVGDRLPADALERIRAAASARGFVEFVNDGRTWAVWPVEIPDLSFTNLYGRDVSAERAIVKFPDENPNPVLRIDAGGCLLYANPASAALVAGLGITPGDCLPDDVAAALRARVGEPGGSSVDVESGGRTYSLLPVDVPGFGFVNVYGTDITAIRERERLARENERLLLNILPGPIAQRLRDGEPLIADRFDDVTLLFADIVDFTRLSSKLTATELVAALNDVFSVFDDLVEHYRLEKVKTIGDAYMVVGGLTERAPDHAARVVSMALDLGQCVGDIESARRLGIAFRVGVHCGPVVAGVIGTKKFIYDIWGDTVNLASRMESLGVPGKVQVTHAVRERLGDAFRLESRGLIDVKGKGPMPTWFVVDRTGANGSGDVAVTPVVRASSAPAALRMPPGH
jgi:class 3 adenylate cyclase